MTTKEKITIIENNFKDYFNASWLIDQIYKKQDVKVAINIETLNVYGKTKLEIDNNQNILYFDLPEIDSLIEGYRNAIMFKEFGTLQQFNDKDYGAIERLRRNIDEYFREDGHFSKNKDNEFYLYEELINIFDNRQ